MKKYVQVMIILFLCWGAYTALQKPLRTETAYDKEEFDRISAFLIYRRQQTETYPLYCRRQNYNLDRLVSEFNQKFARQIKRSETFIARFSSEERLAFYQELNRVYAEMEYEIMDQLEQSYNQNRRIHETAGQSFSRYDFCRWMDSHTDILFKGKTDAERGIQ